MKIFINAKTPEICESLSAALTELSAEINVCCDDEQATATDLTEYDVCIVSAPLRSEFGLNFAAGAAEKCAVVVLARADIAEDVQSRIKFSGAFVLGKPFPKSVLAQTVKMAILARENMSRLEQEKNELSRQLDDARVIHRAKCCLIQYLNLTEEQAHRHLQKMAMDTRRSQRETAEDILRTYSGMVTN